jgi:hypothetical protein
MGRRDSSPSPAFVAGFTPPRPLTAEGWRLAPLRPELNDVDYAAWTSCRARLARELAWGGWPTPQYALEDNLRDLTRHSPQAKLPHRALQAARRPLAKHLSGSGSGRFVGMDRGHREEVRQHGLRHPSVGHHLEGDPGLLGAPSQQLPNLIQGEVSHHQRRAPLTGHEPVRELALQTDSRMGQRCVRAAQQDHVRLQRGCDGHHLSCQSSHQLRFRQGGASVHTKGREGCVEGRGSGPPNPARGVAYTRAACRHARQQGRPVVLLVGGCQQIEPGPS